MGNVLNINMFLSIHQYLKKLNPRIKGVLFKLFFSSSNFKIGKNFKCDTWPFVTIDNKAHIKIGDDVHFRRNIELRAHGTSQIII